MFILTSRIAYNIVDIVVAVVVVVYVSDLHGFKLTLTIIVSLQYLNDTFADGSDCKIL